MLAALRVLHVDASGAPASGGMDRGRPGCGRLDLVMSGGLVVGAVQQVGEELGSVGLPLGCGVVVLGEQGGPELDAGLEEGARLADGLEGAVEGGWSGAVA